jgi:hypothetical protein
VADKHDTNDTQAPDEREQQAPSFDLRSALAQKRATRATAFRERIWPQTRAERVAAEAEDAAADAERQQQARDQQGRFVGPDGQRLESFDQGARSSRAKPQKQDPSARANEDLRDRFARMRGF